MDVVAVSTGSVERPGARLSWAAGSHRGRVRQVNEDSYFAESGVFVVADGMGGHAAGDVASAIAVDVYRGAAKRASLAPEDLASLIEAANRQVYERATGVGPSGMGTTMVGVALIDNGGADSLVAFNVGDSRCYTFAADTGLVQVTRDHSLVQEKIDAGEISLAEAADHPERNVVTRAIGIQPSVASDFFVVPAEHAVRLLLCSDGVSGQLSSEQIEDILSTSTDPDDAVNGLIGEVLNGRAPDNATAVVVDVVLTARDSVSSEAELDEVTGPPAPTQIVDGLIDTVPIDTLPIDMVAVLEPSATVTISEIPR